MKKALTILIEMGFIIFLFYANLLMGEFIKTGAGWQHGFFWAFGAIFTGANFIIAIIAALLGYGIFEFLRRRL
jgi:hypothetical protein